MELCWERYDFIKKSISNKKDSKYNEFFQILRYELNVPEYVKVFPVDLTSKEQIKSFLKFNKDSLIPDLEFLNHEAALRLLTTKTQRVNYLNKFPQFKMVILGAREEYMFESTINILKENSNKYKNNVLVIGNHHFDSILDKFEKSGMV